MSAHPSEINSANNLCGLSEWPDELQKSATEEQSTDSDSPEPSASMPGAQSRNPMIFYNNGTNWPTSTYGRPHPPEFPVRHPWESTSSTPMFGMPTPGNSTGYVAGDHSSSPIPVNKSERMAAAIGILRSIILNLKVQFENADKMNAISEESNADLGNGSRRSRTETVEAENYEKKFSTLDTLVQCLKADIKTAKVQHKNTLKTKILGLEGYIERLKKNADESREACKSLREELEWVVIEPAEYFMDINAASGLRHMKHDSDIDDIINILDSMVVEPVDEPERRENPPLSYGLQDGSVYRDFENA